MFKSRKIENFEGATTGTPENTATTGAPENTATTGAPENTAIIGAPENTATTGAPENTATTGALRNLEIDNEQYDSNSDIIDINNELNKEKSEMDKKLDFVIDKTKNYYYKLKTIYTYYTNIDDSFDKLKILDTNKKIEIIWDYNIKNFKNNYEYIIDNFYKIKKKNIKLNENEQKIKKIRRELKDIQTKILTKEKIYKYNFSKYNEMIFETNLLKEFMIYLIALLIIPILRLADIVNKTLSIFSYIILLCLGLIYFIYKYLDNKNDRDNVFFNKFNFKKPEFDSLIEQEEEESK